MRVPQEHTESRNTLKYQNLLEHYEWISGDDQAGNREQDRVSILRYTGGTNQGTCWGGNTDKQVGHIRNSQGTKVNIQHDIRQTSKIQQNAQYTDHDTYTAGIIRLAPHQHSIYPRSSCSSEGKK